MAGFSFEEKSISGATLGSAKIFTFLASFNAEKRWWAFFEEKSISGANLGSACHTAKAY